MVESETKMIPTACGEPGRKAVTPRARRQAVSTSCLRAAKGSQVDWRRCETSGRTIFVYRSSRVVQPIFPQQDGLSMENLLRP